MQHPELCCYGVLLISPSFRGLYHGRDTQLKCWDKKKFKKYCKQFNKMSPSDKSYHSFYWSTITNLLTKHTFYQPFGSLPLLILDQQWNDCARQKRHRAVVLLLVSFLYRTWQYDNILSRILSDTRLWSSPIINPGWAPAQVVHEWRPTECQHVWQTPSISQTWRWSCTGDTLTLSTAYTVDSAELRPTNPSVELIIRSLLKSQTRPSTLNLNSACSF